MYVRRKATLIGLAELTGQIGRQVLGVEDPDWYGPRFGIDGAIHCVRVPLAGSPLRRFLRAQRVSESQESGTSPAEPDPSLVPACKSRTRRHGLSGASAASRRKVLKRAQILGAFPGCCSFFTPTFSNAQIAVLDLVPDGVQIWQEAFRHSIVRRLKRHTDQPLVVIRLEMHPKRSRQAGMPIPHAHGIARTKSHRYMRGWWLDADEWKACEREAMAAVLRRAPEELRRGPIRHRLLGDKECEWEELSEAALVPGRIDLQLAANPAAYIAKYVSKNKDGLGGAVVDEHPNLIPHQWLNTSRCLQLLVDCCEVQLPPELAEWLWRNGFRLQDLGLGVYREWSPPGCDTHRIYSFYVNTPEQFAQLWELFLLEAEYGRWLDPGAPSLGGSFAAAPVVDLFPA